jgi:hypothetical protein
MYVFDNKESSDKAHNTKYLQLEQIRQKKRVTNEATEYTIR